MNLENFSNKNQNNPKDFEILPACKRIVVIGDIHGDWNITKKFFLK